MLRLSPLLFSLTLLLLTGCATYQPVTPSSTILQVEQLTLGKTLQHHAQIAPPEQTWWTLYQDEQLNQLLKEAGQGSQIVNSIHHRIELAREVTNLYQSQRLPNLSVDASADRERFTALQFIPPPWAGSTYWNNSIFTTFSYNLDLWKKRKNQWLASVDEAKAVALDGQEMVIELHSAIIKLYLELTATYQLKDLSEEELKDTQEQIAIETQRQQVGMGSTAKVNDNEASLPIINNTISALNLRIQLLKTTLAALIGQGPGALDSLKRPTLTLHTNLELPSSLPLHLIANRPDVSAALSRLHEMQKKIQVAQAAFYPDVNLSAFIGFEAIGFSQLLSRQGAMAGVGPALSLPLFDGGLRQGQLNLATTEFDLAVDQYNQRVLDALKEISNSLAQLNSMNLQQQELKKALYKRQQSLLFAKESYQAGLTSYQSVLSNNQNYLTVAKRMVEIDQARLTAYAELMRALGGGSQ